MSYLKIKERKLAWSKKKIADLGSSLGARGEGREGAGTARGGWQGTIIAPTGWETAAGILHRSLLSPGNFSLSLVF